MVNTTGQAAETALSLTGNVAAARALQLAGVEAFPAYPITPQYPLLTTLTEMAARGETSCRFLRVESDHSALAAAAGTCLAGARTFTASNSQGLAYMHEVLFFCAGMRLPLVMAVVNRALSAPHCRFPDHGDAIAQEATGWLQFYCENNQEVLDTIIQAFKVAEDPRVLLPVMVNYEGYTLGDTRQNVVLPAAPDVAAFLGPYTRCLVDPAHPASLNPPTSNALYTEYKYQQHQALAGAGRVVDEVAGAYAARFGRDWQGQLDAYRTEGAQVLLVAMGSGAATARLAVDSLRDGGVAAGLLKVRTFRPFPAARLAELAQGASAVAVLDRDVVFGVGGALARELQTALAAAGRAVPVYGYIGGLGGREVAVDDVKGMAVEALALARRGQAAGGPRWLRLRQDIVGAGQEEAK